MDLDDFLGNTELFDRGQTVQFSPEDPLHGRFAGLIFIVEQVIPVVEEDLWMVQHPQRVTLFDPTGKVTELRGKQISGWWLTLAGGRGDN